MRLHALAGLALIGALTGIVSGCGERRAASPLSPSLLSSPASEDARRAGGTLAPRRVDNDGDGYDDGDPPAPPADPGTGPTPDPNQPPPGGVPPAPVPVQLTISVVGTFGSGAFVPNPLQAAIGNTIVWTNNDLVVHDIVLDNGTPVGTLAPGQSSLPITLVTETAGYRCTYHPSMVGQVVPTPPMPTGEQPPSDPSQGAPPDPTAPPPPPSNDDGGGYPGDDDYYLRAPSR